MVSLVRNFQPILNCLTVALASSVFLCSCITTPRVKDEAAAAPLTLSPPKKRSDQKVDRERWVTIRLPEGQIFAQAKDGMDDVVSLSAAESPKNVAIKTLDDVEAAVRNSGTVKFEKFRRAEVLGETAIRYERKVETNEPESDTLRSALNARSRTMPLPFTTKTMGAIFLHPKKANRYVTLTCTRTSYHGEIGTYYEELFDDFIQNFVVENFLKEEY